MKKLAKRLAAEFDRPIQIVKKAWGVKIVEQYDGEEASTLWTIRESDWGYIITDSRVHRGSEFDSIADAIESIINTGLIG